MTNPFVAKKKPYLDSLYDSPPHFEWSPNPLLEEAAKQATYSVGPSQAAVVNNHQAYTNAIASTPPQSVLQQSVGKQVQKASASPAGPKKVSPSVIALQAEVEDLKKKLQEAWANSMQAMTQCAKLKKELDQFKTTVYSHTHPTPQIIIAGQYMPITQGAPGTFYG